MYSNLLRDLMVIQQCYSRFHFYGTSHRYGCWRVADVSKCRSVFIFGVTKFKWVFFDCLINRSKPNDRYRSRTAPLTSKRCILYIYATNTGTEYFKHGIYSQFFPLQNVVCFIILTYVFGTCIIHILYTECAKIKKNNSGAKRLIDTV